MAREITCTTMKPEAGHFLPNSLHSTVRKFTTIYTHYSLYQDYGCAALGLFLLIYRIEKYHNIIIYRGES